MRNESTHILDAINDIPVYEAEDFFIDLSRNETIITDLIKLGKEDNNGNYTYLSSKLHEFVYHSADYSKEYHFAFPIYFVFNDILYQMAFGFCLTVFNVFGQ